MYSNEQIASATGAPLANVKVTWPPLVNALAAFGMADRPVLIAAAGTISAETGSFLPIPEWGTGEEYNGRADLGNVYPGDGPRYKGRGLIQLTGRANYRTYGAQLGIDLEGNPDLALDPTVAAKVFALYFRNTNCEGLARAGDWYGVRRAVNGGENGIDAMMAVVNALLPIPDDVPVAPPVTTVAVESILRTEPESAGEHAINPKGQPVVLAVGTVVHFQPDPGGPFKGQETTPHWAHIALPNSVVHGWIERSALSTSGG